MTTTYAFPGPAAMYHARCSGRALARADRSRGAVAMQLGHHEMAVQLAARARGDAPRLVMLLPSGRTLDQVVR